MTMPGNIIGDAIRRVANTTISFPLRVTTIGENLNESKK